MGFLFSMLDLRGSAESVVPDNNKDTPCGTNSLVCYDQQIYTETHATQVLVNGRMSPP